MQTLAVEFDFDQYHFTQVKREGDIALFAKRKGSHTRVEPFYEVVIVQKHPAQTFKSGRSYPEREAMPPSESWGTLGWSYSDLPRAQARFDSLTAQRNVA